MSDKKKHEITEEAADADRVLKAEFSEEMSRSYLDYAMSVIVSRAIPDIRDGLKPVQRRTLYAMGELGVHHDKPHRKSARIVGDTMGKYHPHGDSSIYEALVVMAQDWKKEEILVDGHGNFGSIEGDGAAAARYTEARLSALSDEAFLADMDKDVVDFVPNFDETEKEPVVLPVRIPNILVNGADGIAVGMKTSIPTHNLRECIEAMKTVMRRPTVTTEELLQVMPGPDFPTGGLITNRKDLLSIYETGSGKLRLRGKVVFEEGKGRQHDRLVITEIPYTMIGAGIPRFLSDVAALIESRKLPEVTDLSNQSSKEGIRIVLDLKSGADREKVLNVLYRKTGLEDTFGVNMLAVVDGTPRTVSLKEIFSECINFQVELNTRKYTNLLQKERERAEVQEGLIQAVDIIDLIIEIIRGSRTIKDAKACLMGDPSHVKFKTEASRKQASGLVFTERQAQAILDMRLSKLIGLEILQLQKDHDVTMKKIGQYEKILSSPRVMTNTIIRDLDTLAEKFGKGRRTEIIDAEAAHEVKEEIPVQEMVFAIDRFGYVKTYDTSVFGRSEELIRQENRTIFPVKSTEKIFLFTDAGNVHQIKAESIPAARAKDKGVPVDNLCNYRSREERIVGIFPEHELNTEKFLFVTEAGYVKIVEGKEFPSSRKTTAATKLQAGDRLLTVLLLAGTQLVLRTEDDYAIRFPVSQISEMKKASAGVKGMDLREGDRVREAFEVTPREKNENEPEEQEYWHSLKLARRGGRGSRLKVPEKSGMSGEE